MIDDFYNEAKRIAGETRRAARTIRTSEFFHMKMVEFGNANRMTVGEVYDVAALLFLKDRGVDLTTYERVAPLRVKKEEVVVQEPADDWKPWLICDVCTTAYRPGETCPSCK